MKQNLEKFFCVWFESWFVDLFYPLLDAHKILSFIFKVFSFEKILIIIRNKWLPNDFFPWKTMV